MAAPKLKLSIGSSTECAFRPSSFSCAWRAGSGKSGWCTVPVDRGCLLLVLHGASLSPRHPRGSSQMGSFFTCDLFRPTWKAGGLCCFCTHSHTDFIPSLSRGGALQASHAEIPLILGHYPRVTCQNNNCWKIRMLSSKTCEVLW